MAIPVLTSIFARASAMLANNPTFQKEGKPKEQITWQKNVLLFSDLSKEERDKLSAAIDHKLEQFLRESGPSEAVGYAYRQLLTLPIKEWLCYKSSMEAYTDVLTEFIGRNVDILPQRNDSEILRKRNAAELAARRTNNALTWKACMDVVNALPRSKSKKHAP